MLCFISQELSYLKSVWKSKLGTLRISPCSQEPPQYEEFPSDFPIGKETIESQECLKLHFVLHSFKQCPSLSSFVMSPNRLYHKNLRFGR